MQFTQTTREVATVAVRGDYYDHYPDNMSLPLHFVYGALWHLGAHLVVRSRANAFFA
jgi:hypothetical protein